MARWENGLESQPVTTYVSRETKDAWKDHADRLNVSLSRYVEMMVNAGRSIHKESEETQAIQNGSPNGKDEHKGKLELSESEPVHLNEVHAALDSGYTSVEELSNRLNVDETSIYESLQELVRQELAEYDPMKNGYTRKVNQTTSN